MIEAKSSIRHNGRLYREGERIADITPDQAAILVASGSADWERVRPARYANPTPPPSPPAVDDGGSKNDGGIDWEDEVKQYHKGFGNYEIPGVGNVKGKEAAIEALKQLRAKG